MTSPNLPTAIRVIHLLASKGMGGAERLLYYALPRFDSRFDSRIVSFNVVPGRDDEWRSAGIPVDNLHMKLPLSPWAMLKLARLLRRLRPDIVCIYGSRANIMGRIVARCVGVPIVITCKHGIEEWKGPIDVWLTRLTAPLVTLYVTIAQACNEPLRASEWVPTHKLHVILNGIDPHAPPDVMQRAQAVRRNLSIPSSAVVVSCVARIEPIKGHEHLVHAAAQLGKGPSDVRFLIVGPDRRDGFVADLARNLGVADLFNFIGYTDQVADYLAASDVFVLPSLTEGMPISILEAMHMAKPVLATRVGGVPEIVITEETGLLVPPADPQAMAQALARLIDDPSLRQRLGQAGLQRARENFTLQVMIDHYQDLFLRLVGAASARDR